MSDILPSVPEPPPRPDGVVVPDALIGYLETLPETDSLVALVHARDAFGRQKYGQPLMSNDGRNGIEDARQELGDLLQYVFKCKLAGEANLKDFEKEIDLAYQVIKKILN